MDGEDIFSHLIMRTLKVKRSPELHPKERRNKKRFERLPINCLPPPVRMPHIKFKSWSQTPETIKIHLNLPQSSSISSCFLLSETNRVVLKTPEGLQWSCRLHDEIVERETKVLLRSGVLIMMTKRRRCDWPNYELSNDRSLPRKVIRNSESKRWPGNSDMDGFEMLVDDPSEGSDNDDADGVLQMSCEASDEDSDMEGNNEATSRDVTLSAIEFGEDQVKIFLWVAGVSTESYEIDLKMKEAIIRFLKNEFKIKEKCFVKIKFANEIVPHQSHWVLPSSSASSPHNETLELVITKLDSSRTWDERSFSFAESVIADQPTIPMEAVHDNNNTIETANANSIINSGKDASTQTITINILQKDSSFNTSAVHSPSTIRTSTNLGNHDTLDVKVEDLIPCSSQSCSQGTSSWKKSDVVKKESQKPTCMVSPLSSPTPSSCNLHQDVDNTVKDNTPSNNPSTDSSSHTSSKSSIYSSTQPSLLAMSCRKPGYVGLMNLGNTCFINCVIQVLANIPELKEYFLSRKFIKDINAKNPLGMGGRLASSFAEVIEALWVGEAPLFSPIQLKNLIGEKQSRFNGFQQHDAEELMEFLLDGLHEDLNRVKDKLYTAHPEDQPNLDPETAASLSWSRHKSMNDSFIVDLFQGQYHSKLTCPKCGKVSITFDPFSVVQVPIAKKIWIRALVLQSMPSPIMSQHQLLMEDGSNVAELLTHLFRNNPVLKSLNFQVIEVSGSRIKRRMDETSKLSKNSTVMLCEVNNSDSHVKIMIQQRTVQPLQSSSAKRCGLCRRVDGRLRRCTRCFRVSYCNQKCQRDDWLRHKTECKLEGDDIGHPFIISLPRSTTYGHLVMTAEAFASLSVQVVWPSGCSEEAASSSSLSTPSLGSGDAPFMDHNYSNVINNNFTPFTLVPFPSLTSYGLQRMDSIKDHQPIIDQGDKPFDLSSFKFLVMLWRNNYDLKPGNQLVVSEKENCDSRLCWETMNETPIIQLADCFKLFKEPETLSQEQSWRCSQCRSECQAMKELSLWRLPTYLIVHLMRFKSPMVAHFLREKVEDLVQFPIRGLDVSPYLKCGQPLEMEQAISSSSGQSLRQGATQNSTELLTSPPATSSTVYDLFGVINHRGMMMGGHYTSCARSYGGERNEPIGWRLFNDNQVTACQESDVVTSSAYVLFYRQRQPTNFTSSGPSGFQEGAQVIPRDKQSGQRVFQPCTSVSVISSSSSNSTHNNYLIIDHLHHNNKEDLISTESHKVLSSSKTSFNAKSTTCQNLDAARTSYPPLDRTYRIAWPQDQSASSSDCPHKIDSCPSSGAIQKPVIIAPCGSTGTGVVWSASKKREEDDDDDDSDN